MRKTMEKHLATKYPSRPFIYEYHFAAFLTTPPQKKSAVV